MRWRQSGRNRSTVLGRKRDAEAFDAERAGLVRRVQMTRGEGSLIVVTPDGARMVGGVGATAPRSVAPTTWAHVVACAWTAAWFEVRDRQWLSGREIAHDAGWIGRAAYEDGYGHIRRPTHRPDLGTYVGATRRPVAVEVELQRKSGARLRGILRMYATRTAEPDSVLAGVVTSWDRMTSRRRCAPPRRRSSFVSTRTAGAGGSRYRSHR